MGVALYRWGLLASMTVGSHTPRVSVIYCDRCQSSYGLLLFRSPVSRVLLVIVFTLYYGKYISFDSVHS